VLRYELRDYNPETARELAAACELSPTLAQVLLNRGISDPEQARDWLNPTLAGLTAPDAMADREAAADRLARAVRARERIAVFGDYDVDGTTSTAVMSEILERLGAQVSVLVANRFEGGYGLTDEALDRVLEQRPSLLVACDCGSSDHARIERARAAGVDAVVVDHHLVAPEPLPAVAFVNPHRPDCGFPYKGLASVGLVLSLGAAVRKVLGLELDLRTWLDLVALGTIADVAPLDGDNRRLVRAGLALLSASEGRPGVVALREAARIRPGTLLSASDVSFRFSPRLNAAGRLGDPTLSLRLLRARDRAQARVLAARVERINQQRREIEQRVAEEAIAQVAEVYGENPDTAVVAAKEGWHPGVVGICAARLVERFGVPSAVIALAGESGRGSCRSSKGLQLHEALERCRDVLLGFGGHQSAAGLTVAAAKIDAFRAAFAEASRGHLSEGAADEPTGLLVDVVLQGGAFELPTASDLALLQPVGQGNADPIFLVPDARVQERSVVGTGHLKLTLRVGEQRLSAFGYRLGQRASEVGASVSVLGTLKPDTWKGGDQVELFLTDFE
jgi:single-stranded-DNA-specific exonuclease